MTDWKNWQDWSVLQTKEGFMLVDGGGEPIDSGYLYDNFKDAVRDLEKIVADEIADEAQQAKDAADEARFQEHRDG